MLPYHESASVAHPRDLEKVSTSHYTSALMNNHTQENCLGFSGNKSAHADTEILIAHVCLLQPEMEK